jgi:hypothetical protein
VGWLSTSRLACTALLAVLAGALLGPAIAAAGTDNPVNSIPAVPNYLDTCAPAGMDRSPVCLRLTLAAIDAARAREALSPMRLPSDFAQLSVPEQLFVAIDAERVSRGLAPFSGLAADLDAGARSGALSAQLPPKPSRMYRRVDEEWIGDVDNGLDADYQWMYNDGPGSGLPHCTRAVRSGCWVDRDIVLDGFGGSHAIVMGAAYVTATAANQGGSSLAATMAVATRTEQLAYTWNDAVASMRTGTLTPLDKLPADESDTGIPDPARNVVPDPDYFDICAPSGLDSSDTCVDAVLAAINHAHALERVRPMVLPADFTRLTVPQQIFVAINLERIDRGLSPFVGLTAALDANAQKGANRADDPPGAGPNYLLVDDEWAGGSANGLDAVYGWMYQDGFNSGNLDCLKRGAPGCWGHRNGILDDFGSGNDLVMGAALDPTGDTNRGDVGGTSMAATLAVATAAPRALVFTWAEVLAAMPPSASG